MSPLRFPESNEIMVYLSQHCAVVKKSLNAREIIIAKVVADFFAGKVATEEGAKLLVMWKMFDAVETHQLKLSSDQFMGIESKLISALVDCGLNKPLVRV